MNLAPLPTPLEQRALCWVYLVVVAEALFSWTSRSEVCNCCFVEPLADHPLHRHCVGTLRGGHSVDPALCPACQEKEQDDFTVTLLGLRFPDRELVPHFDFSLRPYMLCPRGMSVAMCRGSRHQLQELQSLNPISFLVCSFIYQLLSINCSL